MEKSRALLEEHEKEYLIAKNNCADIQAVLEEYQHRIQQGFEQVQSCVLQIEQSQRMISQMKSEQSSCDSQIAVAQNDLSHNEKSIEETHAEILSYTENKDETKNRLKDNQKELDEKQLLLQKKMQEEEQAKQEIVSIDEEITSLNTELARLKGQRTAYEQDITKQKLNRVSSSALIEETTRRKESLQGVQSERDDSITALQQELKECQELLSDIKEREESLHNTIAGYKMKLTRQQSAKQEIEENCRAFQDQIREIEHRSGILSDMEKSMDGYYSSVKSVLQLSHQGRLSGIIGTVSQLLSVSADYALAIETVLGNSLQNIVTENEDAAKNAINHLKYTKAGRATFLPLDVIKPQELNADGIEQMDGFVARAVDLVGFDRRYQNIAQNLLGRIAVARDIDAAVQIARRYSYRFRVVTLDGQLVNAGGSMTGGSASKNTGLLSRKEEIHSLNNQAEKLREKLAALEPKLRQSQEALSQTQAQLTAAQAELTTCQQDHITYSAEEKRLSLSVEEAIHNRDEMQKEYREVTQKLEQLKNMSQSADSLIDQVSEELSALKEKLDKTKESLDRLNDAKQILHEQHNALRFEILGLQKDVESLCSTKEQLEGIVRQQDSHVQILVDKVNALQNNGRLLERKIEQLKQSKQELSDSIEQENQKIEQAIEKRNTAEQQLSTLRNEEKEHIAKRERAAAQMSRCEERKILLQNEYDKIIAKLWDEYNMTRSDALAQAVEIEDETTAQNRLTELKNKIRALGSVNVAAIEEYKEVSERYEFLKKQCDDVEKSRTELMSLIRELTSQMKQLFAESFEKINQNFQKIFEELFLGGKASLTLTDPDNILESGIDINVQPPGKIIKNLSSLSGGEKAFVAIAIYFAILKVRPSPFCMLDEIEAALDEVNVSRYARYLKNLSDHTQFIAITHRRGTMEEADIMYGVTMQEKGVSKLLELDISQVESRLGMKSS